MDSPQLQQWMIPEATIVPQHGQASVAGMATRIVNGAASP